MPDPIYLDYNATTPLAPQVAAAMLPFLERGFGNPSSSHPFGLAARQAIDSARQQLCQLLGCARHELVFTGGGTESNNMALKGAAFALRDRGRHIITTAVEHPAVGQVCAWLAREGWRISVLPVDGHGRVDPAAVQAALGPDTVLISVMHANNEVGTVQPIAEIAAIARAHGALLHSDGAQAVGKIPCDMAALGVDLYSVAGHKLYAPKGVGALYIRHGTRLDRFLHGADHEANRRAGTENTLGIVGLGAAAALAAQEPAGRRAQLQATRDRLHRGILERVPDASLNGHPQLRLPNTLSLAFPGLLATSILDALAGELAASAGAACHADAVSISTVLQAMEVPQRCAMGTLRLSTGHPTTFREVDRAAEAIGRVVAAMRGGLSAGRGGP